MNWGLLLIGLAALAISILWLAITTDRSELARLTRAVAIHEAKVEKLHIRLEELHIEALGLFRQLEDYNDLNTSLRWPSKKEA